MKRYEASINSRIPIRTIADKERAIGNALEVTPEDIKLMENFWGDKRPVALDTPIVTNESRGEYDIFTPAQFRDHDRVYNTIQHFKYHADGSPRNVKPGYGLNFNLAVDFASQHEEYDDDATYKQKHIWRLQVIARYEARGLEPKAIKDSRWFYNGGYGSKYYGSKSANFKPTIQTMERYFEISTRSGYAIAPGLHTPKPDKFSHRSKVSLDHIHFYLLDFDNWSDDNPNGMTPEELLSHPFYRDNVWGVSESISSRSPMSGLEKFKYRLWIVTPELITDIDYIHGFIKSIEIGDRIIGVDYAVGKDPSRQSFGNAREGIFTHINGKIMSDEFWSDTWDKTDEVKRDREESARRAENFNFRRDKEQKRQDRIWSDLKRNKVIPESYDTRDPIDAFVEAHGLEYLILQCGVSHVGYGRYKYDDASGDGMQFDSETGVVTAYSSTLISRLPHVWQRRKGSSGDSIKALRMYPWMCMTKPPELYTEADKAAIAAYVERGGNAENYHIGYDIAVASDTFNLRKLLHAQGYGTLDSADDVLRKNVAPNSKPNNNRVNSLYNVYDNSDIPDDDYHERIKTSEGYAYYRTDEFYPWESLSPEIRMLFIDAHGISPNIEMITNEDGEQLPPFSIRFPFENLKAPHPDIGNIWWRDFHGTCSECSGKLTVFVKRHPPIANAWCPSCERETWVNSLALYEMQRKAGVVIDSNYKGFVADDEALADATPWQPYSLFHLAAPMGSGKTYWAYLMFKWMHEQDPDSVCVMLLPRVTLTKSVYHQFRINSAQDSERENDEDGDDKPNDAWGLWCEGSDNKIIGDIGVVSGVIALKAVITKLIEDDISPSSVKMIADEIDFVKGLLSSEITEEHAVEIKEYLREVYRNSGIITMGQTAIALHLEKFVKQLGGFSYKIVTYDKLAQRRTTPVHIVETCSVESKDGKKFKFREQHLNLLRTVLDNVYSALKRGFNAYVFCRERRMAKELEWYIERYAKNELKLEGVTVVFTRCDKGGKDRMHVINNGALPEGKRVLIANMSIDVGLSIYDENGVVFAMIDGGPASLYSQGVFSTTQQTQRVRNAAEIRIYYTQCIQEVPTTPTEEFEIGRFFNKGKPHVAIQEPDSLESVWADVDSRAVAHSLNNLASYECARSLAYHLDKSGFDVNVIGGPESQPKHPDSLKLMKLERRKMKAAADDKLTGKLLGLFPVVEDETTVAAASKRLSTLEDIRKNAEQGRLSVDGYDALSLETAYYYARIVGYHVLSSYEKRQTLDFGDDEEDNQREIPVMSDDQYEICRIMSQNLVIPRMIKTFQRGFALVHYPHTTLAGDDRILGELEAPAIKFDKFLAALITAVLKRVPDTCSYDEMNNAIHNALLTRIEVPKRMYGTDNMFLGEIARQGGVAPSIARKLRFVSLKKPNTRLTQVIIDFIETRYPVKFIKKRKQKRYRKYRHVYIGIARKSTELACDVFDPDDTHAISCESLIPTVNDPKDKAKFIYEYTPPIPETDSERETEPQKSNAELIMEFVVDEFTSKDVKDATGMTERQFRNALKQLINNGKVVKVGYGKYKRT